MPVSNTVKVTAPDPSYSNEMFRASHGYKEAHQHDAPFRRSRDFKPVPYGTFGGMPNYRHAEAWCQLKNIKDLVHEQDHHPTKWAKAFLGGATAGVLLGAAWVAVAPVNGMAAQKLFAKIGERPFSGRMFRMVWQTAPWHAMFGGALALSY